jgi:AraC family transcriptional regulator
LAAVAHLSVYHFARQLRRATGLPPQQYVIVGRVEPAKQLLSGDLSLPEVTARARFSARSHWGTDNRG